MPPCVLAQFAGGLVGVLVAVTVLGKGIMDPAVGYIVTIPGAPGVGVAFLAETVISFGLMFAVLAVSNTPRLARFTGLCAGLLVLTYITFEAPLSGMSMNPARTLGSAIAAQVWTALGPLHGPTAGHGASRRAIQPAEGAQRDTLREAAP